MGWMGGIIILVLCEFYYIRENENQVEHPSNNKSIVINVKLTNRRQRKVTQKTDGIR